MTMREMQKAVYQNKVDKGFNITNVNLEFNLIYGEVAEAFEAWERKKGDVGEELADVVIYALGLSEILGVDLQAEIEHKIEKNRHRVYQTVNGVTTRVSEGE